MSNSWNRVIVIGAASWMVLSMGCLSQQTGKDGNFQFSYYTDDDLRDFNKPLALGAKLDMIVREAGTNPNDVSITSAESDDPNVMGITGFSGNNFTLEGLAEGEVELTVEGNVQGGDTLSDRIDFQVRTPEKLRLWHTCEQESVKSATYLVGQAFWMPYEMELANGRSVIGYDYNPVDIAPAGLIELKVGHKGQQYLRFDALEEPGTVTLSSKVDDSQATITLVDEGAIDTIELYDRDGEAEAWVDRDRVIPIRAMTAGMPICQARTEVAVATSTEDICEVSVTVQDNPDLDEREREALGFLSGLITVKGKTVGVCTFEVTLPKANMDQGITETFTIDVVEYVKNTPEEQEGGEVSSGS